MLGDAGGCGGWQRQRVERMPVPSFKSVERIRCSDAGDPCAMSHEPVVRISTRRGSGAWAAPAGFKVLREDHAV